MELTRKRYTQPNWRKLVATRKGTMLVGLACALVAGGILAFAMASYRHSVDASANPETVLVASQLIAKNTPGAVMATENVFKASQIAAKQVSAGAIADASALQGKVAARDILPGEQLTAADFTASGGLPTQLAPAQRAMTVTLDAQHGMLGMLHDGDHVDVYAGAQLTVANGQPTPVLRLLMTNVDVLKAGTTSNSGGLGASSATNTSQVTLNVDDSKAGALAYAADNGKVWLVLRPANATETPPQPIITVQSLLYGTKPVTTVGGH
jgi:Flp pilus assembly protein CpaB